jgi:3-dehydroquinate synthase
MTPSLHAFDVPFRFPVYFTRNAWDVENRSVRAAITRLEAGRRHRVLVVIDDQVDRAQPWLTTHIQDYFAAHAAVLELVREPMVMPGGEAAKNDFVHTFTLLQRINEDRIDRQSFLAVIGGGAMLDMVSFAAAIAHRGIRVVRFPTTVLAQGDSGIAVKNSVNLFGKKNFIGTFVPPFAVINDVQALATLPLRDKVAGVSEAVKVALLKSPEFYRFIEAHADRLAAGDLEVLAPVVRRSAELHLAHICGNGDPFELGSARPLDFGHWAAHKLESVTSYRLRHGEAVAIGMALDLMYSVGQGFLDRVTMERVLNLLEALGFTLWDDALREREADGRYTLIKGLQEFREHLGGDLHITLLRGIGASFEATEMDEAAVIAAIEGLEARASRRVAATRVTRAASVVR